MKKNILVTIFSIGIITGCATQNPTINTNNNKKFTEDDCKKMLGLKTYNQLNELYADPDAAMLQCRFRREGKVK